MNNLRKPFKHFHQHSRTLQGSKKNNSPATSGGCRSSVGTAEKTEFGTKEKKKTAHFYWLMPATNHVNPKFYYSAELPDPSDLLGGSEKLFRHIKIKSVEQLSDPDLIVLLEYATTYTLPVVGFKG